MSDLLFDASWWIPALVGVIGICLFFNGNKRQLDRTRNAGFAVIGIAAVWTLMGMFVDTGKKIVRRESNNFIQYAVERKWEKFKAEMTPATRLSGLSGAPFIGADKITNEATFAVDAVQLKYGRVQKLVVEQSGTSITATFDVFSQQDNFKPLITSGWRLEWEQTATGWKIREIRCLEIDGKSTEDLIQSIPRNILK